VTINRPLPVDAAARSEDDRIRGGVLRFVREAALAHESLPGEVELAKRLECTRQQVRHALSSLERQGIVKRRQGAATVVDPVALRMSVRLEEQLEHSELLARMGYQSAVEVIESELVAMPESIAPLLTSQAGPTAFRVVKRWTADGVPAMVAENHVAFPLDAPDDIVGEESVFTLAERVWGESIVWEVATPGVTILDAERAELLGLPVGSAALTLEIIGTTVSGRRTFHAFETHNPAIVSYSFVRTVRPPWSNSYSGE
jgi:DNA-binding GntR family transcriptional regulator